MFKYLIFLLVLLLRDGSCYETNILSNEQHDDLIILVVETKYQMGERENLEEVRRHILDTQKEYAVEYAGSYVQSDKSIESIGDAGLTRFKRFIAFCSPSITYSKVIKENLSASMLYTQDATISIDKKAMDKEISREVRLSKIFNTYGGKEKELHDSKFETFYDPLKKNISFNKERVENLAKFGRAIINTNFIECSVSSIDLGQGSVKTGYLCSYNPAKEVIKNYQLYYKADINDIVMHQVGEGSNYSVLQKIGNLFKLFPDKVKAKSATTDVSFENLGAEYVDETDNNPEYVEKGQKLIAEISLYGFDARISFPVVEDGKILSKLVFRMDVVSNLKPGEAKIRDIAEWLRIKETHYSPLVFNSNYSLFASEE